MNTISGTLASQAATHVYTDVSLEYLMSDSFINPLLDKGYLPHAVIRLGIRRQLAQRLASIASTSLTEAYEAKMKYVAQLRTRPIAVETKKANEQHYEVGTGVLVGMLGPRMKYSSCWYETGREGLGEAEEAMLAKYVERADLKDEMKILDLGCVLHPLSRDCCDPNDCPDNHVI